MQETIKIKLTAEECNAFASLIKEQKETPSCDAAKARLLWAFHLWTALPFLINK